MHSSIHLLITAGPFTTTAPAQTESRKVFSALPDQSLQPSFGVGFDLTPSYGSAAVSFCNGTTVTLSKIFAEGYTEVVQRLSLISSKHPSPPYASLGESWDDMPRQYLRKVRKALGLPASSDVGHLASMLIALREEVEGKLGGERVTEVGVTTMNLVALYDEDLRDACEYAGLGYVGFPVGYVGHNILYETSAAYAGYGFGLCTNVDYRIEPEACRQEEIDMDDETVMAVLYTDTVLSVSLSILRSAYALWEPQYRYLADFDLGYNKLRETKDPEEYWRKVELKLQQIMIENPFYERPRKVLLMGDRTDGREFGETLVRALGEQMDEMPEILGEGAGGVAARVAARGVAEMGMRVRYRFDG